jgi:hypothetical protein
MMDEANIENDVDQHEQHQGDAEAEAEAQRVVADTDAKRQRHLKIMSVLGEKEDFSFRTRNKMDVLVEEFLFKLENDIHDMFCVHEDAAIDADIYLGLDSERDTEKEVETTVRFFPDVLTRRKQIGRAYYPIQYLVAYADNEDEDINLMCNTKAASFIPLLVRLAIELGLFEEQDRGGLLCEDSAGSNILQNLVNRNDGNQERHELVDTKYLQVLIQLRKIGLFKKEDIQRYSLFAMLFLHDDYHLSEKILKFLVEWDPTALLQADEHGWLPLNYAAAKENSIRGFQLLFQYGIFYYPKKIGISLIFKKTEDDGTPFESACGTPFESACINHGINEVLKVVEDTLILYASSENSQQLNIAEALIMAATDEHIDLDAVYFFIRRQPDILWAMDNCNIDNDNSNGKNYENDNLSKTKTNNPKKRKRKEKKKSDGDGDDDDD